MDKRAIGIFDTDGGGLAAARELKKLLPHESFVYLCDSARAPYGGHSKELIAQNALRGLTFLQQQDVKLLLCACGTTSAVLAEGAPKGITTPLLGALLPCAQQACAASVNGKIGLIGTPAAVRSGAYGRAVRNIRGDARVIGAACPLLDPLADSAPGGDSTVVRTVLAQYLQPLKNEGVDTLVLSSLRYAPLFGIISEAAEYNVTVIDSSLAVARHVQSWLLQNFLQSDGPAQVPVWYVTDAPEELEQAAPHFWDGPIPKIKKITLE